MNAVLEHLDVFWVGICTTLALTLLAGTLALAFGIVLAAMRVSAIKVLRAVGTSYVEIFRNVPSTILFFFAAFVLPEFGFRFSYFFFAVIALTIYYASFFCEVVRSGINAVPIGQVEAARSVGMGFFAVLRIVVLPQGLRSTIPPLINVYIALIKSTAIASAFGVMELLAVMQNVVNEEGQSVIAILLATALFYLAITIPAGMIAGHLEQKQAFSR